MLDSVLSAGSTSSAAPSFSRQSMKKSLADELDSAFENIDLSTPHALEPLEFPKGSHEEITEDTGRGENAVTGNYENLPTFQPQAEFPAVANANPGPQIISEGEETPKKSRFIEKFSPTSFSSHPLSHEEHINLMASKHNRELIDRKPDGFFKMGTVPSVTDVQRRAQQEAGIAALQRTLVPATVSGVASSDNGSSSSAAANSITRPPTRLKVNFGEPRTCKPNKPQRPYVSAASRSKTAPRFSLARDLIASGHKKRISEPSAPTRFVRMPTDPVVDFRRSFAERGLKISIPGLDPDGREATSVPDVDSARTFHFRNDKPKFEFEFGVPRAFIADQCFETSCPIRFAHAKGPYHHKGHRDNAIMTGLFGHSNPPPEIWNAYRNMIRITRDGEIASPEEFRPRPNVDEDLVIAFAMFHYGELNSMSGKEFHKRYAGRHMSSVISLQSTSTNSSTGSGGS